MPLAFRSLNQGVVAFGFFHIETDMLLLGRGFFFAPEFCALISNLAAAPADQPFAYELPGYVIDRPEQIGDLHGAIAGVNHAGFIGALYARRPFPTDPAAFSQQPEGYSWREEVARLILNYGSEAALPVRADWAGGAFELGGCVFDPPGLRALVDYVWRGGMPGWRDGERPDYLIALAEELAASDSPGSPARILIPIMSE